MRVPENQLRVIRENEFGPRKPINPEAFKKVYRPVEQYLQQSQPGFRMFAEVGMGGFIQTTRKGLSYRQRQFLYAAYGSKRIDFLVIDPFGRPALAIEYQGTGHAMRDDTVERDQVKRAILFAAGIRHIEVHRLTDPAELIGDVTTQIEGHKAKFKQSS